MPLTIVTGKYETGSQEIKNEIMRILGSENTSYMYNIYFHWYNVMHEVGHAICTYKITDEKVFYEQDFVKQEIIVNDFAVAYWSHYGEKEKLEKLKVIMSKAFENIINPAPNMNYIDYAVSNWNNPDFWTFNNYGFFQFSCVRNSLSNPKCLKEILTCMSGKSITPQPKQLLEYTVDTGMSAKIVQDAVKIINKWGIDLPPLSHVYSDDPFKQMCINTDWQEL